MRKDLTISLTVMLVFGILQASSVWAVPPAVKAKSEYLLAEELFKAKDYKGAIGHAENAKDILGKSNSRIEYMLTKAYYAHNSFDKALQASETFFNLTPESESATDQYNEMVVLYSKIEAGKKKKQAHIEKNSGRWVDKGDSTVTDPQPGLMWAAAVAPKVLNLAEAREYCQDFAGGGHTDWRLPTTKELETLYVFELHNVNDLPMSILFTTLIDKNSFWSSDSSPNSDSYFSPKEDYMYYTDFYRFAGRPYSKNFHYRNEINSDHPADKVQVLPVRRGN